MDSGKGDIERKCTNCDISSNEGPCERCKQLPCCVACKRHLPSGCYANMTDRCQACNNRREKPQVHDSENEVVNKIDIKPGPEADSFQSFIASNGQEINNIVEQHLHQFRYVISTIYDN